MRNCVAWGEARVCGLGAHRVFPVGCHLLVDALEALGTEEGHGRPTEGWEDHEAEYDEFCQLLRRVALDRKECWYEL